MSNLRNAAALAAMAVVLTAVLVMPAGAATRDKVTTGTCSKGSHWTLTLKRDHGRIEADLEIRKTTAGQQWKSVFRDNGTKFGHALTTAKPDGSLDATRRAKDRSGADAITVKATNLTTGEVCKAAGTF